MNADLANVLGNCLNRATAKRLNPSQTYPSFHEFCLKGIAEADLDFIDLLESLPNKVHKHFEEFHFYEGIFEIMNVVREANMIIVRNEMWNLTDDQAFLKETLLYFVYEGLRVSGILLQPIIPELADKLLDKLGVLPIHRSWRCANQNVLYEGNTNIGNNLGKEKKVLFRNLKD